ncbi:MAG: 50S ribosomal protein L31e [Candidatus Pacearchaeota archaeon]|nr:50S ribosomal protein L31e [Candidatus Pacearchaeota archaeon]
MVEKKDSKNIEREYVIPLREKCRPVARYKKTNKAIKSVKEFLARHMKIRDRDLNKIKLDIHLNEFLWARGIKNPPHKVKVKAVKEGDIVRAELAEYPDKIKFKKARLEKREAKAKESLEKNKTMMDKAKESMQNKGVDKKEEKTTEDKIEEKEKKASVVEEGEKILEKKAKVTKKVKKVKSPEQIQDNIKEPQAK